MRSKIFTLVLIMGLLSCQNSTNEKNDAVAETEVAFNRELWLTRDGTNFPYRERMYKALFEKDTLKKLKKEQVLQMLGEPTRVDSLYLFYRITEDRVGMMIMRTKTLVIKLREDNSVEKVMIHG